METVPVSPEDYAACLADLARVNTVTLARLPTLGFLARLARRHPGQRLRVLDVACGEGDMLRRVARWARRRGIAVTLTGLDLSEQGLEAARRATPDGLGIGYVAGDVFTSDLGDLGEQDAIISSLFTHHLPDEKVADFLALMERTARLGWFVNDLERHGVAAHGFRALAALAGWHRFVRHDGPVSVRRAFTMAEWLILLRRAGLDEAAVVRRHVPFRLCVTRLK